MNYYMAYGSNLNKEQMHHRCPGATPVTTGQLLGFELVFRRGYLTIERKPGGVVPVGIWSITEKDEKNLDLYEGFPTFYRKATITKTWDDGVEREVMMYIMNDGYEIQPPTDRYFYTVMRGFTDFSLDKKPLIDAYTKAKWRDEE